MAVLVLVPLAFIALSIFLLGSAGAANTTAQAHTSFWGNLLRGVIKSFAIGVERAGIVGQVFIGTELEWIDEDAGDEEVRSLLCAMNQGYMTVMQIAHGRHQCDFLVLTPGAGHERTQRANRIDCLHRVTPL